MQKCELWLKNIPDGYTIHKRKNKTESGCYVPNTISQPEFCTILPATYRWEHHHFPCWEFNGTGLLHWMPSWSFPLTTILLKYKCWALHNYETERPLMMFLTSQTACSYITSLPDDIKVMWNQHTEPSFYDQIEGIIRVWANFYLRIINHMQGPFYDMSVVVMWQRDIFYKKWILPI